VNKEIVSDYHLKIKGFFTDQGKTMILLGLLILCVASASFVLGIAMGMSLERQDQSIAIEYPPYLEPISLQIGENAPEIKSSSQSKTVSSQSSGAQGVYVASKSGTRYYLPNCSGVSRIKEENKVWFQTKEQAEARGLLPAANCPGL
jgi:hypothetical protein